MTPADLRAYCQKLSGGNVADFCRAVGISRDTYYRQARDGAQVSDLTRFRVLAVMETIPTKTTHSGSE
jgi:transposase-like protein